MKKKINAVFALIDPSPLAAVIPALLIIFNAWYLLVLLSAAVTVHEVGHYAALKICGGRVEKFRLGFLGCCINYSDNMRYSGEIITSLAGPFVSAFFGVASALVARVTGIEAFYHFAAISIILGAFNLLPAYPLDGGRALYNTLALFFDMDKASKISFVFRCVTLASVAMAGLLMIIGPAHNPCLAICAVYLLLLRDVPR